MNETQILLTVSLSISAITLLILLISSISNNKKINYIRDQVFMSMLKHERILKTIEDIKESEGNLESETINALEYIADTVESLSSSNETVLRKMTSLQQKQAQQHPQKIYPRPQVASEITATIKEQIQMELIKSRKLKAPRADYLNNIIENVSKTYPDVAIDYIANKCVAIIESMGSGGPPREQ
jgi:uncharacterized protein YoxC